MCVFWIFLRYSKAYLEPCQARMIKCTEKKTVFFIEDIIAKRKILTLFANLNCMIEDEFYYRNVLTRTNYL